MERRLHNSQRCRKYSNHSCGLVIFKIISLCCFLLKIVFVWVDDCNYECDLVGGLRGGIINYIENFGFYEGGGSQNPYRVDPDKLYTLLTGQKPPQQTSTVI